MDRIDALRTFIKVMEAGSFTQVADQLGIGQPAVSKRIALLEAEFRTKLFQRSTRSLKPTHEADRILKAARDILATYDDVMAPETPREARPTGLLRIAVPTSFGRHYFHRIFLEYRRRYPEVKIAVQSSDQDRRSRIKRTDCPPHSPHPAPPCCGTVAFRRPATAASSGPSRCHSLYRLCPAFAAQSVGLRER
jgi:DNA-binding transcriptional LysR family regulator